MRRLLHWAFGLSVVLQACVTVSPTPAHIQEALSAEPDAWVVGIPKGVGKPIVLNNQDFVWTIAPMPGQEGAAFSRMASKQFYASLWTLEKGQGETQGKLRCELPLNETAFDIEGMAFVPEGKALLAVSRNGNLYAVDSQSCALKQTVAIGRPLVSVAVDLANQRIAVGAADGWVALLPWPLPSSEEKGFAKALHADEVRALAFDKAGHLFTGGFDKRIVQWLVKVEEEGRLSLEKQKEFVFESYVNDFSLDALGKTLGVALSAVKAERTMEVYQREKRGKKEPVRPGDGGALVNVETGEQKAFFAHRGTLTTAGISPDGQMLVTGGFDKRILFHRPGEKTWAKELGWSVRRLRFSPSGRYVWAAAWTPQLAEPDKPSAPSALAYELLFGEDAFVRTLPVEMAVPRELKKAANDEEGGGAVKSPAEE